MERKSQKGSFRSVRTSGDVGNWRSFVPIRSRTRRQNTYHLVHRANSQMHDFGRESRSKVRNQKVIGPNINLSQGVEPAKDIFKRKRLTLTLVLQVHASCYNHVAFQLKLIYAGVKGGM